MSCSSSPWGYCTRVAAAMACRSRRRSGAVAASLAAAAVLPLAAATRGERDELDGDGVELRACFDQMRGGFPDSRGFPSRTPGGRARSACPAVLVGSAASFTAAAAGGSAGPVRVAHNLREPPGHLQGLQGLRDRRVPGQGEERSATERPRGVGVGGREMLRAPQEQSKG